METAAVRHYPMVTKKQKKKKKKKKHRNKGYFDQNNTVRIPNVLVTHFVHKACIIANKIQKNYNF